MQQIVVELIILSSIIYTLYSAVRMFKPVKKKVSCGCSLDSCSKFDSS